MREIRTLQDALRLLDEWVAYAEGLEKENNRLASELVDVKLERDVAEVRLIVHTTKLKPLPRRSPFNEGPEKKAA